MMARAYRLRMFSSFEGGLARRSSPLGASCAGAHTTRKFTAVCRRSCAGEHILRSVAANQAPTSELRALGRKSWWQDADGDGVLVHPRRPSRIATQEMPGDARQTMPAMTAHQSHAMSPGWRWPVRAMSTHEGRADTAAHQALNRPRCNRCNTCHCSCCSWPS